MTKGQFCPYDENKFCQEGNCNGCQIYIDAIGEANRELCPVCGADLAVWRDGFGENHHCGPEWAKQKVVR